MSPIIGTYPCIHGSKPSLFKPTCGSKVAYWQNMLCKLAQGQWMQQQCTSQVALQNADLSVSITTVLVLASCQHKLLRAQTGMADGDNKMGRINSIWATCTTCCGDVCLDTLTLVQWSIQNITGVQGWYSQAAAHTSRQVYAWTWSLLVQDSHNS